MATEPRMDVGAQKDEPRVVSSAIELDRDFIPAEVTRTTQSLPTHDNSVPPHYPRNDYVSNNVTNVSTTVNVGGPTILITTRKQQVPFVLRALWFLAVGFWLSAVFIVVGYICCLTIILAPVGFWFLNRVPQAQTLRMRNTEFHATQKDGVTHLTEGTVEQLPWYYRAIYFPFGLVFGLVWLSFAWLVSLLIVTLPLSVWMIDHQPSSVCSGTNSDFG